MYPYPYVTLRGEGGGGGWGDSHMKGAGIFVGYFELKPLKETVLGVAQAFNDP